MSWWEWLLWRRDRRAARRVCAREGHDITGPHVTAGGWYVFTCTRCPYRFLGDRVVAL